MRDKAQWAPLIPHQGTMCLLDSVVAWDDTRIHARSASHARPDNPLRSGGQLRALHLCEYGAQAMAVHGGLLAQIAGARAAPGLLVSLRDVRLTRDRVDDLPGLLDVHGERLLAGEQSWQYAFRVEHDGVLIASGRAAVMVQAVGVAVQNPSPPNPPLEGEGFSPASLEGKRRSPSPPNPPLEEEGFSPASLEGERRNPSPPNPPLEEEGFSAASLEAQGRPAGAKP